MNATQAVESPISVPRALHGVPNAVVIDGASVRFPDHLAVDRINLTAVPMFDTILGLIGPSG